MNSKERKTVKVRCVSILSDADTGKILDILDDRRNFKLKAYFLRFTLKARKKCPTYCDGHECPPMA